MAERPRPPPGRGPNGEILPKRGPGRPPRQHRYGCMCIICKQVGRAADWARGWLLGEAEAWVEQRVSEDQLRRVRAKRKLDSYVDLSSRESEREFFYAGRWVGLLGRGAGTLPPLDPTMAAAVAAEQAAGSGAGTSQPPQFLPQGLAGMGFGGLGLMPPPFGRGGPGPRFGKRAYIRAVPHVVAGMRRHK
eukprot:scaffold14300_cov19-Tisochrysis_lutea.AAC.3